MKKRGVAFLAFLYFSYLLVGAAIFWEIEFGHEEVLCRQTIAELQEYNITNTTEEGNITIADLRNLVELLIHAKSNGVQFDSSLQPSCAHNWDYPNSFFFAGTVITTIGYGNISPSTEAGRVFCIFFAAFGIPLFGILFDVISGKLALLFKKINEVLSRKIQRSRFQKICFLFLVLSSLIVFVLLLPALIFTAVEGWTYHEAFYYSFITLTTIGFGDFVVGTNPDQTYFATYRIVVYLWILFGLAFMSTVIKVFADVIKQKADEMRIEFKRLNEQSHENDPPNESISNSTEA